MPRLGDTAITENERYIMSDYDWIGACGGPTITYTYYCPGVLGGDTVGGKKHADLKNKNFEEIQVHYKKVKMSDKDFIAIGSIEDERRIKEMNEESKDPKKKRVVNETLREKDTAKIPAEQEVTEQGTKKRKSGHMNMIAKKRPRPQPDDDSDDEHRKCLRIVTFDSTLDSEIMETKSFVSKLYKVSSPDRDYLVVYRVNGHFRAFNYLMEVLNIFNRQDLFHLYDLVMKQYSEITPECIELILWGHLKIMMESSTEENDQELKDGTVIYMLVERRCPLSKELLQRMLDLGLEVEEESTVALHLIRFIKQQLNEEHQELTSPEANGFCEELASPGSNSSWLSIHLVVYNEELAIPEQTATGKGISNPLMADLEEEPAPTGETSAPPAPKTAKQLAAKRNQERVKSILLLAIPDEYLLKFHNVEDAKSLWEAIKSRFGGNEESKKMQKNVLKHQFENFSTTSNESLDKAYDRFQKLISELEVHGAPISKEDINYKFLRSLPPSWNQIALISKEDIFVKGLFL
ncbi:hypothetical protein Tco_0560896 [Tanacetum coccineum]